MALAIFLMYLSPIKITKARTLDYSARSSQIRSCMRLCHSGLISSMRPVHYDLQATVTLASQKKSRSPAVAAKSVTLTKTTEKRTFSGSYTASSHRSSTRPGARCARLIWSKTNPNPKKVGKRQTTNQSFLSSG